MFLQDLVFQLIVVRKHNHATADLEEDKDKKYNRNKECNQSEK